MTLYRAKETWIFLLYLLCSWLQVDSVELTFELPDNAKQCFHEDIQQGVKSTVEFQVCYQVVLVLSHSVR